MKYKKIKDKKQLEGLSKIMSMKDGKGRKVIYADKDGNRYTNYIKSEEISMGR